MYEIDDNILNAMTETSVNSSQALAQIVSIFEKIGCSNKILQELSNKAAVDTDRNILYITNNLSNAPFKSVIESNVKGARELVAQSTEQFKKTFTLSNLIPQKDSSHKSNLQNQIVERLAARLKRIQEINNLFKTIQRAVEKSSKMTQTKTSQTVNITNSSIENVNMYYFFKINNYVFHENPVKELETHWRHNLYYKFTEYFSKLRLASPYRAAFEDAKTKKYTEQELENLFSEATWNTESLADPELGSMDRDLGNLITEALEFNKQKIKNINALKDIRTPLQQPSNTKNFFDVATNSILSSLSLGSGKIDLDDDMSNIERKYTEDLILTINKANGSCSVELNDIFGTGGDPEISLLGGARKRKRKADTDVSVESAVEQAKNPRKRLSQNSVKDWSTEIAVLSATIQKQCAILESFQSTSFLVDIASLGTIIRIYSFIEQNNMEGTKVVFDMDDLKTMENHCIGLEDLQPLYTSLKIMDPIKAQITQAKDELTRIITANNSKSVPMAIKPRITKYMPLVNINILIEKLMAQNLNTNANRNIIKINIVKPNEKNNPNVVTTDNKHSVKFSGDLIKHFKTLLEYLTRKEKFKMEKEKIFLENLKKINSQRLPSFSKFGSNLKKAIKRVFFEKGPKAGINGDIKPFISCKGGVIGFPIPNYGHFTSENDNAIEELTASFVNRFSEQKVKDAISIGIKSFYNKGITINKPMDDQHYLYFVKGNQSKIKINLDENFNENAFEEIISYLITNFKNNKSFFTMENGSFSHENASYNTTLKKFNNDGAEIEYNYDNGVVFNLTKELEPFVKIYLKYNSALNSYISKKDEELFDLQDIDKKINELNTNKKELDETISNLTDFEIISDSKIVAADENINDFITRSLFDKQMVQVSSNMELTMSGPSGVGKTVFIAGFNDTNGIKTENGLIDIFKATEKSKVAIFDIYGKCFPFDFKKCFDDIDILEFNLDDPTNVKETIRKSFKSSDSIPFTKFRDQTKKMYDEVTKTRRRLDRIRSTKNNDESSRSILLTSIAIDNNGTKSFKNILDAPGNEDPYNVRKDTSTDLDPTQKIYLLVPVACHFLELQKNMTGTVKLEQKKIITKLVHYFTLDFGIIEKKADKKTVGHIDVKEKGTSSPFSSSVLKGDTLGDLGFNTDQILGTELARLTKITTTWTEKENGIDWVFSLLSESQLSSFFNVFTSRLKTYYAEIIKIVKDSTDQTFLDELVKDGSDFLNTHFVSCPDPATNCYMECGLSKEKMSVDEFFQINKTRKAMNNFYKEATGDSTKDFKNVLPLDSFEDFVTNVFIGRFFGDSSKYGFFNSYVGTLELQKERYSKLVEFGEEKFKQKNGIFKAYPDSQNFLLLHENIVCFFAAYVIYYYKFIQKNSTEPSYNEKIQSYTNIVFSNATNSSGGDVNLLKGQTELESCFINEFNNIRDASDKNLKKPATDPELLKLVEGIKNNKSGIKIRSREEMIYWSLEAVSDFYLSDTNFNNPTPRFLFDCKTYSKIAVTPHFDNLLTIKGVNYEKCDGSTSAETEKSIDEYLRYNNSAIYSDLKLPDISIKAVNFEDKKRPLIEDSYKYKVLVVRPAYLDPTSSKLENTGNYYAKAYYDQIS